MSDRRTTNQSEAIDQNRFRFALLLVASAVAQTADDQSQLIETERQWNEAGKNQNVAWMEKRFAVDLTDISSGNGALQSKARDLAIMKDDKSEKLFNNVTT